MKSDVRTAAVLIGMATLALGCTSPAAPPSEPMLAAPEAPRIPWLAAGAPDIAAPQIPWLTDESACPDGWGWIEIAPGVHGCDPYPTGYVEDCGPTGAHFPGEAGCRDLDSGDTEWPRDLPATNVLYVREGASGGDGTIDAPFATLPDALAVATEGTTIALGPGRYDAGQGAALAGFPEVFETLSHVRAPGVRIRGTSVARTTIVSARPRVPEGSPGDIAMIVVEAADVEISDLRFESEHPAVDINAGSATVRRAVLEQTFLGFYVELGASGVFEDVVIREWSSGTTLRAAIVAAGALTVRRAVIRTGAECVFVTGPPGGSDVPASIEDLACSDAGVAVSAAARHVEANRILARGFDLGLVASNGAEVAARWLRVIDPRASGLDRGFGASTNGGRILLEDLVATQPPSDSGAPVLVAQGDASITVSRAVVFAHGCIASERSAEIAATDLVCVGGTTRRDVGGIVAASGSTVRLSRADVRDTVLYASQSTLALEDVSVTDTRTIGRTTAIRHIDSTTTLTRVSLAGAQVGVAVEGGTLDVTDLRAGPLTIANEDEGSVGLFGALGASVTLTRSLIEDVEGVGVLVAGGGSLHAEDLVVRDVHGPPGRPVGVVIAGDAAPSALARVEVSGSDRGVVLLADTAVEDLLIHDVTAATDGLEGFGLVVGVALSATVSPTVTGTRIAIADVASLGLLVKGAPLGESEGQVSLSLSDLRIERVGTSTGGAGVWARGAATASLTRFVVRDTATVGLSSERGATLTLADGLVAMSTTCTASESPLDLTTVLTDACGAAPVALAPPLR